jgi:hypothetical protein
MVSDLRQAIKTPLDKRLGANENSIPDLESLQVTEMNTPSYPYSIPKLSCDRSPDGPTH